MRTDSAVTQLFDAEAARYDAAYDDPGPEGHVLRARLATVIGLLGDGSGKALDAGMGPGRLCIELRRRNWTVIGLDASERMVALARARIGRPGSVLCARVERLPFPDGSFDAVAAIGVLEYLTDMAPAIHELVRILRPGGRAVLSYPNAYALYAMWQYRVWFPLARATKVRVRKRAPLPPLPTPVSPHSVLTKLRAFGLAVKAVHYVGCQPILSPFDFLFPRLAVRVATSLEGVAPPLRHLLASQIVFAADKVETVGALVSDRRTVASVAGVPRGASF